MKRQMENMRLYNEQAVQVYQHPVLAPVAAHEYQPGAVVVRVQQTEQAI